MERRWPQGQAGGDCTFWLQVPSAAKCWKPRAASPLEAPWRRPVIAVPRLLPPDIQEELLMVQTTHHMATTQT